MDPDNCMSSLIFVPPNPVLPEPINDRDGYLESRRGCLVGLLRAPSTSPKGPALDPDQRSCS
jgi:hypothetical protein